MSTKVALVTGGARGIGLAIAQKFAASGFNVMVGDLGSTNSRWNYALSSAEDLAKVGSSTDTQIATCQLDVTQQQSCEDAVSHTLEKFGHLDVLVNNAGVVQSGPVETFSEQDWDQVFAVNSKGIFLMAKAALDALTVSTDAAIVNTASIAGKKGVRNMVAYCGSKFAAIGITQSLAIEFAPRNIRVNAICPGSVSGDRMKRVIEAKAKTTGIPKEELQQDYESMVSLKSFVDKEDIASMTLFLISNEAKKISGQVMTVDGNTERMS